MPLTGAVFDILVEVFQQFLVEQRFISRELDELSRTEEAESASAEAVQAGFDLAYAGRHDAFKAALIDARDYVGCLLAGTWRRLGWDPTFNSVAAAMLATDVQLTAGACRDLLIDNLAWRGIGIGFRGRQIAYRERLTAIRDRRW